MARCLVSALVLLQVFCLVFGQEEVTTEVAEVTSNATHVETTKMQEPVEKPTRATPAPGASSTMPPLVHNSHNNATNATAQEHAEKKNGVAGNFGSGFLVAALTAAIFSAM